MKKDPIEVSQVLAQPKEVKIEIPEGYCIDESKSTFEKIVFKKKDTKPRSWEEYCKNYKGDFYYITTDANVVRLGCNPGRNPSDDDKGKNVLPNKELAEAFLAMMQLMSLRQAWVGEWKINWRTCPPCIKWQEDKLIIMDSHVSNPLSFSTKEMATDFMNTFKDLLEIAKPLI